MTASAICATVPQPRAVAIAMPTTSPITQPIRQCVVAEKAARLTFCSAGACKPLNGFQQFPTLLRRLFRVTGGEGVGDTVIDVIVEELEGQALEGSVHRGDLSEDVDAVTV